MKNFLVLYMATVEQQKAWADTKPEDQKKGMEEWILWMDAHKDAFVDAGNPTGRNYHVDNSGATEKQNEICGYSIVKAETAEAVHAMFVGSPHLKENDTWVDVMPIVEMT